MNNIALENSAIRSFLENPQPSYEGLIFADKGQYSMAQLELIFSHQKGRPLNADLSGIPPHLIDIKDRICTAIVVDDKDTHRALEHAVANYINRAFEPDKHALHHDEQALIDSLQRYAANHSSVSIETLARSNHFKKLAKNAFISQCMKRHYYIYTALIALFARLDPIEQEALLPLLRATKDKPLYIACLSIHSLDTEFYPQAAGLLSHYMIEVSQSMPLHSSDNTEIILEMMSIK